MKKIINILAIMYMVLLYYLVSDSFKLIITMNFGVYLLLLGIFNNINKNQSLIYSMLSLFIIGLLLSGLFYGIGSLMNIMYLNITNLFCVMFLTCNNIIRLLEEHFNNKKLYNMYYLLLLVFNIILLIIFRNNYNIIYLYIMSILFTILIFILLFIFKRKRDKKYNFNYIKNIRKSISFDKENAFSDIIKSAYLYISIIVLYYIMTNRYISYNTNIILSDTYLFGMIFIYILYKIIKKYIVINYDIKEFNNIINKVLNVSLYVCILLFIISFPICKVIFNSDYNFIFSLIILLFFYILFDTIMNISNNKISNRKINISLLLGLLVKIIFEIPLINSSYRMGYDLVLGSILSSSLGMITTIIINVIFITKKYKINLLSNFNNILNIVYSNIIYLLILVLCTLIVKVDGSKYFINILVIMFYVFVSVIFYIIRKIIHKKSAK